MKFVMNKHIEVLSPNELLSIAGGESTWDKLWSWVGKTLTQIALAPMPTKTDDYDHWDYYNPNDPLL